MSYQQFSTLLAQADHFLDPETGAVTPPIYNSSTFARDENYEIRTAGAKYSRIHNPTHEPVERLLAKLEGGSQALLFGSGLGAATAISLQGSVTSSHGVTSVKPGSRTQDS